MWAPGLVAVSRLSEVNLERPFWMQLTSQSMTTDKVPSCYEKRGCHGAVFQFVDDLE